MESAGRFELWRDRFREVNETAATPDAVAGFSARSAIWRLGPPMVSENRTPARRMVRAVAHCARDDLDHWMLRVRRTGRIALRGCGAAGPEETASVAALRRRRRAERAMRAQLGSARLDARLVCAATGLSRSAPCRLFEADGGVAAHIQRPRLALVRGDLEDPALAAAPIRRIAERRGLFCAPSFSRAFRRTFGATPSDLRRSAHATAVRTPATDGAPAQSLSALMRATAIRAS